MLEKVGFVMKAGRIYRNDLSLRLRLRLGQQQAARRRLAFSSGNISSVTSAVFTIAGSPTPVRVRS